MIESLLHFIARIEAPWISDDPLGNLLAALVLFLWSLSLSWYAEYARFYAVMFAVSIVRAICTWLLLTSFFALSFWIAPVTGFFAGYSLARAVSMRRRVLRDRHRALTLTLGDHLTASEEAEL